jgi:TolB-like protein
VQSEIFLSTARLDSWKEIAAYVSRSVRTVRRWEARNGLPVHRIGNQKGGSVYAYKHELDAWWESHKLDTDPSELKDKERPQAFAEILETASGPTICPDGTARRAITTTRLVHKSFWLWSLAAIAGVLAATYGGQHAVRRDATFQRIHSLAVLPLENLSGDIGQEYFTDGMTAELITELAKIESLHVISRTSAMRYKHTNKPLKQIARELRVDAVLEGEVLNSKRRVRVTAQLIQAATDKHLWAETYERDLRDAVELQGEIAESITDAIRTKVTP